MGFCSNVNFLVSPVSIGDIEDGIEEGNEAVNVALDASLEVFKFPLFPVVVGGTGDLVAVIAVELTKGMNE